MKKKKQLTVIWWRKTTKEWHLLGPMTDSYSITKQAARDFFKRSRILKVTHEFSRVIYQLEER